MSTFKTLVDAMVDTVANSSANRASDINNIQNALSALLTQNVINVKDYGAKGDGSTDDITAINNAIASLPGNTSLPSSNSSSAYAPGKGGIIYFPEGVYIVSTPIIVNKQAVIIGAGWTATEIRLKSGSNCEVFIISGEPHVLSYKGAWNVATTYSRGDFAYYTDDNIYIYINASSSAGHLPTETSYWLYKNYIGQTGVNLSQMFVNGNSATGAHDVIRIENAWDVLIDNVLVELGQQHGISYNMGCWHSWVVNSSVEYMTGDGIYSAVPANKGGLEGIFLTVVGSVLYSLRNGCHLAQVNDGNNSQVVIKNNYFGQIKQNAIKLDGAVDGIVEENTILNPNQTVPDTYDAILVTGDASFPSSNNSVSGNIIQGSNHRYAINIDNANCINNLIANNIIKNSLSINDVAGNAIKNNTGYITENKGTATVISGQTSIAVNHGLSYTPSAGDIIVNPTNSMGNATKFYVGNYTGSQFTIYVNVDPGATTATFAWMAQKG